MTSDTGHVTRDTQGVVNIVSKFQVTSTYGLGVMMFCRLGGKGLPTELTINNGVCRTALATQGLLIIIRVWNGF